MITRPRVKRALQKADEALAQVDEIRRLHAAARMEYPVASDPIAEALVEAVHALRDAVAELANK